MSIDNRRSDLLSSLNHNLMTQSVHSQTSQSQTVKIQQGESYNSPESQSQLKPVCPQMASASCSRQTFVMGRSRQLLRVLIRTCRTNPLRSGKVCITRPTGQEFRGAVLSIMTTRSPTTRFLFTPVHLWRSCSWGRYSLTHLLQNKSDIYWTCFHLLCV